MQRLYFKICCFQLNCYIYETEIIHRKDKNKNNITEETKSVEAAAKKKPKGIP